MSTSIETSMIAVDRGLDGLKNMSMADLRGMFCMIVKAPDAPKFSDKTAAATRILKLANEVLAKNMEQTAETKTTKAGRPKAKPREYMFISEQSEEHVADIAKQAQCIHQNMVHGQWITEADTRAAVEQLKADGKLQTTQSSWRIFQYYRATMINRSLLKMRNAE